PALRARAIHRQLADGLEAAGARRSDDLLRLVTARLEAGQGGTPQLLVAGARRALGSFNPVLGERLARAAADAGGGVPAQLALAQALFGQGRQEQSDVLLGLDGGIPDQRVRAATAILGAGGCWRPRCVRSANTAWPWTGTLTSLLPSGRSSGGGLPCSGDRW